MSDDVAAFLLARLDEDEAAAKAARARHPTSHGSGTLQAVTSLMASRADRALREVEAKRKILAGHEPGHDPCDAHDPSMRTIPCTTVLALAAIYSSHPDYRDEWAA